MRHNKPYYSGMISLTAPPTALRRPQGIAHVFISFMRSTSRSKSAARKAERPAATCWKGSGSPASVQRVRTEVSLLVSSRKYSQSSPQLCRKSSRSNSRPRKGWNGWVNRNRRLGRFTPCAVDRLRLLLQASRRLPVVRRQARDHHRRARAGPTAARRRLPAMGLRPS